MNPLTEEELARLEALAEKATAGPWSVKGNGHDTAEYVTGRDVLLKGEREEIVLAVFHSYNRLDRIERRANATFTAEARTALPLLITALRGAWRERLGVALDMELERLRAEAAEAEVKMLREALKAEVIKARGQGMACAAGIICNGYGEPSMAAEILGAGGLTTVAEMRASGVDPYDVKLCRPALTDIRQRRKNSALRPSHEKRLDGIVDSAVQSVENRARKALGGDNE